MYPPDLTESDINAPEFEEQGIEPEFDLGSEMELMDSQADFDNQGMPQQSGAPGEVPFDPAIMPANEFGPEPGMPPEPDYPEGVPDDAAQAPQGIDPLTEEAVKALKDTYDTQEQPALEARMRLLKFLDFYWQGIQNIFWNDTLGDFAAPIAADLNLEEALPKIVNIYKPYGESIIAALSALTPKARFFPEDAEQEEDCFTAQAYSKIAKKIEKDNGAEQLLTKALFIDYNQHFILAHVYPDTNKKYGVIKTQNEMVETESVDNWICPDCGMERDPSPSMPPASPEMMAEQELMVTPQDMCPNCGSPNPAFNDVQTQDRIVQQFTENNKTKICIDLYGSLNAFVPSWVKKQEETPYVAIDTEKDESWAKDTYPAYKDKIGASEDRGLYQRWARLPEASLWGNYSLVTVSQRWYRDWSYNCLDDEKAGLLKAKFPKGVYAIFINDVLVSVTDEDLDECIKITENPIYNSIYAQPKGYGMIDIQDMTSDNVNIVADTIRFGIPITFVRSDAVDLQKLSKTQARPGDMVAAKPSIAGSLNDQFFQTKTAQLSDEIPAFQKQLEQYAQFVSGAYASIYGGALQGSGGTLGEYESSKNQSLQRLQLDWRLISSWWVHVMLIACNQYVKNIDYDDKMVDTAGPSYINTFIKQAELTGKVGRVEPEYSDQFPTTWSQKRDILQNLLTLGNEEINGILGHFKNVSTIKNLIGLQNLYIPGEDDVDKQLYEISLLVKQQPIPMAPPDQTQMQQEMGEVQNPEAAPVQQQMPQGNGFLPSIEADAEIDEHEVHIGVCKIWLKSAEGLAQKGTPGYQNVEAHMQMHQQIQQMQMQQMMQQQMMMQGNAQPPQSNTPENQG
jgi:hypothetical protein